MPSAAKWEKNTDLLYPMCGANIFGRSRPNVVALRIFVSKCLCGTLPPTVQPTLLTIISTFADSVPHASIPGLLGHCLGDPARAPHMQYVLGIFTWNCPAQTCAIMTSQNLSRNNFFWRIATKPVANRCHLPNETNRETTGISVTWHDKCYSCLAAESTIVWAARHSEEAESSVYGAST